MALSRVLLVGIFAALLCGLSLAQYGGYGGGGGGGNGGTPIYGYGNSTITFNATSVQLMQGGSGKVVYKVSLASGNTWGTNVHLVNWRNLSSSGINVTLTNATSGYYPPFYGLAIIKAGGNATAGQYSIVLNATGDDPTAKNAAFNLTVTAVPQNKSATQQAPSNTVTATSNTVKAAATNTSMPNGNATPIYRTNNQANQSSGRNTSAAASNPGGYQAATPPMANNYTFYIIAVAIIVVILIIAAASLMRRK